MKRIYLIIFLGFILSACENKKITKYYDNGNIMMEGQKNDIGLLEGKKITYYENGKKEIEAIYKNDTLNGPYVDYYENGHKRLECFYKNGIKTGVQKGYYINGMLHSIVNQHNDIFNGEVSFYFTNQTLKIKGLYEQGEYLYFVKYDSLGNIIDKASRIEIDILNKIAKHDSIKIRANIFNKQKDNINKVFATIYKLPLSTDVPGVAMTFSSHDSCYYYSFKPVNDQGKFKIVINVLIDGKFPNSADSIIEIYH